MDDSSNFMLIVGDYDVQSFNNEIREDSSPIIVDMLGVVATRDEKMFHHHQKFPLCHKV